MAKAFAYVHAVSGITQVNSEISIVGIRVFSVKTFFALERLMKCILWQPNNRVLQ